jgi:two-component system chemotaxis response regulator CheY
MIDLDNGLAAGFLAECGEQLANLETELLALENGGPEIDEERANRAFRAAHSVRGGAYFLDLAKIGDLAHHTEDVLELIRSRKLAPTSERVDVLLRATDRLRELFQNPGASNQADITDVTAALSRLPGDSGAFAAQPVVSPPGQARRGARHLQVLIVEDDFTSRLLLQTFLSRYGDCHIAVNGREAVEACRALSERGKNYDLICMDIMMPEMDGREAVRQVRALEEAHGIFSTRGAKITMTTTVRDIRKVFECFKELCDAYLVKPIDLGKLSEYMKSWQLIG